MNNLTQCERVLKYIETHGSITNRDAMLDFGCQRLASRIHDLKRQGYEIKSKYETDKNRYGESTSYKRYYLD